MTLTLQHEEVQQYFDMKDDLAHYKARCHELEEVVANYRSQFNEEEYVPCPTEYSDYPSEAEVEDMAEQFTITEHTTGFSRPKDMEPARACKNWSQSEYDTIRFLFNRNGKYNNQPFTSVSSELFPEHSIAAVYTKLREFGFRMKNDRIVFPIKLDYTEFPS